MHNLVKYTVVFIAIFATAPALIAAFLLEANLQQLNVLTAYSLLVSGCLVLSIAGLYWSFSEDARRGVVPIEQCAPPRKIAGCGLILIGWSLACAVAIFFS